MLFDRCFRFVDAPDLGPTRAFPQVAGQFRKLLDGADRIHLYASVVAVSNVSLHSKRQGGLLHKIAEPHALHLPADPVETCEIL
jgi:hypothetical protein